MGQVQRRRIEAHLSALRRRASELTAAEALGQRHVWRPTNADARCGDAALHPLLPADAAVFDTDSGAQPRFPC